MESFLLYVDVPEFGTLAKDADHLGQLGGDVVLGHSQPEHIGLQLVEVEHLVDEPQHPVDTLAYHIDQMPGMLWQ